MWHKYNDLISQIFPSATHQECIFHALKEVQKKTALRVPLGDKRNLWAKL